MYTIDPFLRNVPLLKPPKALENLLFFDIFRWYWSGRLVENRLKPFMLEKIMYLQLFENGENRMVLPMSSLQLNSVHTHKICVLPQ